MLPSSTTGDISAVWELPQIFGIFLRLLNKVQKSRAQSPCRGFTLQKNAGVKMTNESSVHKHLEIHLKKNKIFCFFHILLMCSGGRRWHLNFLLVAAVAKSVYNLWICSCCHSPIFKYVEVIFLHTCSDLNLHDQSQLQAVKVKGSWGKKLFHLISCFDNT